MAEDNNPTTAPRFELDGYDGAVDLNNLPSAPWTREALGDVAFHQLAVTMGAGSLLSLRKPSIDIRSFGEGRANRLIELHGLDVDSSDAEAFRQEGLALQEAINAKLPPIAGTPRHPSATPLTPATTVIKQRKL